MLVFGYSYNSPVKMYVICAVLSGYRFGRPLLAQGRQLLHRFKHVKSHRYIVFGGGGSESFRGQTVKFLKSPTNATARAISRNTQYFDAMNIAIFMIMSVHSLQRWPSIPPTLGQPTYRVYWVATRPPPPLSTTGDPPPLKHSWWKPCYCMLNCFDI